MIIGPSVDRRWVTIQLDRRLPAVFLSLESLALRSVVGVGHPGRKRHSHSILFVEGVA